MEKYFATFGKKYLQKTNKVNLSTRLIPLICVHGNISRVFFW